MSSLLMPLISFAPIETDLGGPQIDARLAQGWFPYGQRWMTCRVWPMESAAPHDTVWVRVRLMPERPHERLRRLGRQGATIGWASRPRLRAEHQDLYARFRAALHPDWGADVAWALLLHDEDGPGGLWARTREISVRDASGALIAYRWFLQGSEAIAGIACIYDPAWSGLGSIARGLADRWALQRGLTWSYPGYVRPGHPAPWTYKIRQGCTEWLDPDTGCWHPWQGGGPPLSDLALGEMRRRLGERGVIQTYPRWAVPLFDPSSRELPVPHYVTGARSGETLVVTTWDVEQKRYVDVMTRELEGARIEMPEAAVRSGTL